jgi:hypothetical protein
MDTTVIALVTAIISFATAIIGLSLKISEMMQKREKSALTTVKGVWKRSTERFAKMFPKFIRRYHSDILSLTSTIFIVVSLRKEYLSGDQVTREMVLNVALLYGLLAMNLISFTINKLERSLYYWVDELISLVEDTNETFLQVTDNQKAAIKAILNKDNPPND